LQVIQLELLLLELLETEVLEVLEGMVEFPELLLRVELQVLEQLLEQQEFSI